MLMNPSLRLHFRAFFFACLTAAILLFPIQLHGANGEDFDPYKLDLRNYNPGDELDYETFAKFAEMETRGSITGGYYEEEFIYKGVKHRFLNYNLRESYLNPEIGFETVPNRYNHHYYSVLLREIDQKAILVDFGENYFAIQRERINGRNYFDHPEVLDKKTGRLTLRSKAVIDLNQMVMEQMPDFRYPKTEPETSQKSTGRSKGKSSSEPKFDLNSREGQIQARHDARQRASRLLDELFHADFGESLTASDTLLQKRILKRNGFSKRSNPIEREALEEIAKNYLRAPLSKGADPDSELLRRLNAIYSVPELRTSESLAHFITDPKNHEVHSELRRLFTENILPRKNIKTRKWAIQKAHDILNSGEASLRHALLNTWFHPKRDVPKADRRLLNQILDSDLLIKDQIALNILKERVFYRPESGLLSNEVIEKVSRNETLKRAIMPSGRIDIGSPEGEVTPISGKNCEEIIRRLLSGL